MTPENPMPVRVQKYLSQKGICSRREGESYIREGRLTINGRKVSLGDKAKSGDKIYLDGKSLDIPEAITRVVLAFNKPKGIETTLSTESTNKTLADIDFGVGRVFPIGRLDKESHGILLLTNDGALANEMMHPRFEKTKEYIVRLNKNILKKDVDRLEKGMLLGRKRTAPCNVETMPKNTIRMTLKEGKNRQIRRMCGSLGYEVLDLQRIRFGDIKLANMKLGTWEDVTDKF